MTLLVITSASAYIDLPVGRFAHYGRYIGSTGNIKRYRQARATVYVKVVGGKSYGVKIEWDTGVFVSRQRMINAVERILRNNRRRFSAEAAIGYADGSVYIQSDDGHFYHRFLPATVSRRACLTVSRR